MLISAFPDISKGYLFRIYAAFQKYIPKVSDENEESTSCGISLSDTVPVGEESSSMEDESSSHTAHVSSESEGASSPSQHVPNLTRPLPKEFPLHRCRFGFHAKDVIRTGNLTEAGKREITSELISVMRCYER